MIIKNISSNSYHSTNLVQYEGLGVSRVGPFLKLQTTLLFKKDSKWPIYIMSNFLKSDHTSRFWVGVGGSGFFMTALICFFNAQ